MVGMLVLAALVVLAVLMMRAGNGGRQGDVEATGGIPPKRARVNRRAMREAAVLDCLFSGGVQHKSQHVLLAQLHCCTSGKDLASATMQGKFRLLPEGAPWGALIAAHGVAQQWGPTADSLPRG